MAIKPLKKTRAIHIAQKELNRITKIINAMLACTAADIDRTLHILRGLYLETVSIQNSSPFVATVTAANGKVLVQWWLTIDDLATFQVVCNHRLHHPQDDHNVFFQTAEQAATSSGHYPNYRPLLPSRSIPNRPVYFSSKYLTIVDRFLRAIDAHPSGPYIPTSCAHVHDDLPYIKSVTGRVYNCGFACINPLIPQPDPNSLFWTPFEPK